MTMQFPIVLFDVDDYPYVMATASDLDRWTEPANVLDLKLGFDVTGAVITARPNRKDREGPPTWEVGPVDRTRMVEQARLSLHRYSKRRDRSWLGEGESPARIIEVMASEIR